MEADLAHASRQVPVHPPQLLGERGQGRSAVERQPRHGQLGQRGHELRERRATGDGQLPRTARPARGSCPSCDRR